MGFGNNNQQQNSNFYNYQNINGYTYVDGMGFAPPPPIVSEKMLIRDYANGIGLTLLLYILFSRTVPLLLIKIFSFFIPTIRMVGNHIIASQVILELIKTISYAITMLIPFLIFVTIYKIPTKIVFPTKKTRKNVFIPCICIGIGISVIGNIASNAVASWFYIFGLVPTSPDFSLSSNIKSSLLLIIQVGILAPIIEEFIFRGAILQTLRRFGDTFALLVSSIMFAVIHANLVQSPHAFILGLVIGYFVLRTGNIYVGISIHMVNNLLSLLINFSMSYVNSTYKIFVMAIINVIFITIGIIGFLYIIKKYKNLFYLNKSITVSSNALKIGWFGTSISMIIAETIIFILTVSTVISVA